MNRAGHGTGYGSVKRMPRKILPPDREASAALPNNDFTVFIFYRLGTEISGKAVFFSVQQNHADDTGEVEAVQRNIGNGQH